MTGIKPAAPHLAFSLFIILFLSPKKWLISSSVSEVAMAQNVVNVNVGVVLDMDKWVAKMGLSCMSMALSDFYASIGSNYKTRLVLNLRDSKNDVVAAAAAALDLLKNVEVQAIIGPVTSMQAEFVINLGDKAQVPIISYSATSPTLRSQYFFRAAQKDSSQVQAISAVVKAFGWREAVPVYVDDEFGDGVVPFLADALQEIDARIPYRSVIPPSASDDQIVAELYKLMTMQTRVFVVHMYPSLASRFFTKAKEVGMMSEGYVWIVTDAVANVLNSLSPSVINLMEGALGVRPHVSTTEELENFSARWTRKFQQDNPTVLNPRLNIFGLWAYDAATALAMAVESAGLTSSGFQKANVSGNSTDLEAFGVSQVGPKLLQALTNTTFRGLAGNFSILDGQLESSAYEIINVIGHGERRIGFWTTRNGIVRELNAKSTSPVSRDNLGSIIWPGDTTSPPKGWVVPTNGKELRIGVPVKDGFSQFVQVIRHPETNTTTIKGYCIDVFDAVMAALPYSVPYKYVPFATPDGKAAGTYDDLVYEVYLGNFDVAVGDTTIRANRSQYADFSLPYTESGVSMIVPIKDNKSKNAWVFLKPLTPDLWVTSFCSFVFIGFVVWVLEHRINDDFRGPPSHQAGMIFWFSFSTMVFAHKEKVVSNLARFVVIIWCFVVLILTQSYTASLTSMLTVQQLQPTVSDISELKKNGEYVGYQKGSFVLGLLMRMGFDESKLRVYASIEELDELFQNGSRNGGIAAAFDEIPYTKLFLAKHCSKYTTVQPTYKTDGFGFVFPIGSPLVHDVSREVLNVTEGEKMVAIEKKWFGAQTHCPDPSTSLSSNSLGLNSFWGLFLIALVASLSALIIFVALFMYEQRHVLRHFNPRGSIWSKIVLLGRQFDKKDYSSHTFRKSEFRDRASIHSINAMGTPQIPLDGNRTPGASCFTVDAIPTSTGPPSASSSPNHTDGDVLSFEGTSPYHEHGNPTSQAQAAEGTVSAIQLANLQVQTVQETPIGHSAC